jgi:hypothetical protein
MLSITVVSFFSVFSLYLTRIFPCSVRQPLVGHLLQSGSEPGVLPLLVEPKMFLRVMVLRTHQPRCYPVMRP